MKTNPNEPINGTIVHDGLTKRELFAYGAMKALLQNTNLNTYPEHISKNSVAHADALIKELNK